MVEIEKLIQNLYEKAKGQGIAKKIVKTRSKFGRLVLPDIRPTIKPQ